MLANSYFSAAPRRINRGRKNKRLNLCLLSPLYICCTEILRDPKFFHITSRDNNYFKINQFNVRSVGETNLLTLGT